MFIFLISLLLQLSVLTFTNSSLVLGVSSILWVLGGPQNVRASSLWGAEFLAGWMDTFITAKVYGALGGFVGISLNRWASWFGRRQNRVLSSTVFFTFLILLLSLGVLDFAFFYVILSFPLAITLTALVCLLPALVVMNCTTIFRSGLLIFYWWVGVRDPFDGGGFIPLFFRNMAKLTPAVVMRTMDFNAWAFQLLVLIPVKTATAFIVRVTLPKQFHVGLDKRDASRVSWAVTFFLFSFFDFEFLVWIIVGGGVIFFSWGFLLVTQLFGLETIFDVFLPTFLSFTLENVSHALLVIPVGVELFIGETIRVLGLRFSFTDPEGTEFVVFDRQSLMDAPPHMRRDIVLGYLSFSGLGRIIVGLCFILFFCLAGFFIRVKTVLFGRTRLVGVAILQGLCFATIPFMVTDQMIDVMDFGWEEMESRFSPFVSYLFSNFYSALRVLYPFLGIVWYHTTHVPKFEPKLRPLPPRLSGIFFTSLLNLTRRSTLKLVENLNQVRLPEFISNVYEEPTLLSVTRAYQMLIDVGFPVNKVFLDSLTSSFSDPTASSYLAEHGSWKRWFLGSVSTKLGYNKLKVGTHTWLPENFFEVFPGYLHVASWNGEEPEVRSTARYWTGNEAQTIPGGSEPLVQDLWEAVKVQYKDSKLASFEEIYSGWVKRFNMGFGFLREKDGKFKQLTRREVIQYMGGKWKFLQAWEKVFLNGLGVQMPAPVFAKYESLKPSKAVTQSVRTIVGSPFVHHVMTTVFNLHPNHNYKVWETPMKVGMPINGQNYNRLWESMLRHDRVWAGDMTAFDSQVSPAMVRVVAAIRKAGYTLHKDRNRICELIDVSYETLIQQPMGFKNIGDLAWKNQGFTTGHSSTSSDNSLALVANYLFAWRRVTGLRAREFFNHNTLANFGDDHILGYDLVFGWCPERMISAMAEIGTIMRDEAPGEHRMPSLDADFNKLKFAFLAKQPVPLNGKIRSELSNAGIEIPLSFATAHVRSRLEGKLAGENLMGKVKDTSRSYLALISYIHMCAHHHDLYLRLVKLARDMYQNNEDDWTRRGLVNRPNKKDLLPTPPSYNQVLRAWYSKEPFPYSEDGEESKEDGQIYLHLQDDVFGAVIRWMADFPTMLSPRYVNTNWADWLQVKLAWALNWPISFIAQGNNLHRDPMAAKVYTTRTPYAFLRNEALIPNFGVSFGVLATRHYLFIGLSRLLGVRRGFSILDLLRLSDSFIANLTFALTGQVATVAIELDLHLVDTLLVLLCSFVNLDCGLVPLNFLVPMPSLFVARLFSFTMRFLTPSGAIDYQPLDEQIRHLMVDSGKSFTLAAPTGTGKSTRMMMRILSQIPSGDRIACIQPRRLVAIGVGEYMKQVYPTSGVGILTEGYTYEKTDRLIYTTVQSFLLNPDLRTSKSVWIILDEAHVYEPHYIVMRRIMLAQRPRKRIFVTATPTPEMLAYKMDHLAVPAVNQNTVHCVDPMFVGDIKGYVRSCREFIGTRTKFEKTLIFCPTKAMQYEIARGLPTRLCILNSDSVTVDPTASVFISTSVADAGLTIPDVQFVLSLDFDVTVTRPDEDYTDRLTHTGDLSIAASGIGARPYFYKLSEQTITQRKGRTGRTMDGVFMLFTTAEKTEELKFSGSDFFNGLRPANVLASRFFPKELLVHEPYWSAYSLVWDALANASFTGYQTWWRQYRATFALPDRGNMTVDGFKTFLSENLERIKFITAPTQIYALDPEDPPELNQMFHTPVSSIQGTPEVEPVELPPPRVWGVQDVSGDGLLCGVRCVLGLVYSHTDQRPTMDQAFAAVMEYAQGPYAIDRNFTSDSLTHALWFHWRILVTVEHTDGSSDIPPPPYWDENEAVARGTIIHRPGHYNYVGYSFDL